MDKTVPGKEVPEEVTRESLIAISYSLPDKFPNSKLSSETLNGENLVGGIDCNGEEKYRSELISISYTQSPDTGVLPDCNGEEKHRPELISISHSQSPDTGSQPVTPGELKG